MENKTIKSLEGIRGLAAIIVTLHHFGAAWYLRPIEYGYLFVDLFFVLSGFVVTLAYSSRLTSGAQLRPFLIRRFGRLYPLMIFSTVLFVLAFNAAIFAKHTIVDIGYTHLFKNPDALAYMVPQFSELIGTATFMQGMGWFNKQILNYVSWSISAEFYTYLLFAAVCIGFSGRWRLLVSALLSVVGIAVAAWTSLTVHDCLSINACYAVTYDFGFFRCMGSFFLGALAFHASRKVTFNETTAQIGALGALFAFFALIRAFPLLAIGFPLLCAFIIITISKDKGFLADFLNRKPMQVLGQRSFSIYMLHPIILLLLGPLPAVISHTVDPLKNTVFTIVGLGIYLTLIIVVAGWSYAKIETPSRDWFNRLARGRQDGTPAAIAAHDVPAARAE